MTSIHEYTDRMSYLFSYLNFLNHIKGGYQTLQTIWIHFHEKISIILSVLPSSLSVWLRKCSLFLLLFSAMVNLNQQHTKLLRHEVNVALIDGINHIIDHHHDK